jgi:hypothetical protein
VTGRGLPLALCAAAALGVVACSDGDLDAGRETSHGPLPVDERNPVILANDSAIDNWSGEYAVLLANSGGPPLVGVIVSPSAYWMNLDSNLADWNQLLGAATASGLRNIPVPTASPGQSLVRPPNGDIKLTVPNGSPGARLIVDKSKQLSLPWRPLVVVTGSRLTEVADAYLLDNDVANRVVVVSSLGKVADSGGAAMAAPNGELDPWADWIVSQKFVRYVQVSGYYDQTADVTTAQIPNLPANALGSWMAAKAPTIWKAQTAADQVGILSLGLPGFVGSGDVKRMTVDPAAVPSTAEGPPLVPKSDGSIWLVSSSAGSAAKERLWQMLMDPATYGR